MIIKVLKIIVQIGLIFIISSIGNWLQTTLHIPIAGSIIGLILFFLLLLFKIIPEDWVKDGANFLLSTMLLFFIPSIVGIMDVAHTFELKYIYLLLFIIFSTLLVGLSSGYIAEILLKRHNKEEDKS